MRRTLELTSILLGLLGLAALAVHQACQLYTGEFHGTPTTTVVVTGTAPDDAGADE